ncbi:cell division protein SepF [Gephyromycinifex aptenodytis]|uniref:cell division protein SepF n=1 Tax=Gephyromycinifex aptenodytis TaxID=2716227 RepID=UPI0014482498|nr:cell division protein SepF [Gephyromycinifex aptenodytis]
MAGALRKAWVYLGLADEDERDVLYDEDTRGEEFPPARATREVEEDPREHEREPLAPRQERPRGSHVALAPVEDEEPRRAEVTPIRRSTPVAEVVKDVEVTGVHRITTIHPRTYNEAKNIGESFRQGTPVIMNLTDLDDADAKRLVDFAAGLVFGLQGSIERVTNKVFLLSPANLEVTSTDGSGSAKATRGLFNQS